MLSRATLRSRRTVTFSVRTFASVEKGSGSGAIGEDGRHEIWREGIYDHDNEPKVSYCHIRLFVFRAA